MLPEWFYKVKDQVAGPFTSSELREHVRAGRIQPYDFIRRGTQGSWVSVESVKDFFDPPVRLASDPNLLPPNRSQSRIDKAPAELHEPIPAFQSDTRRNYTSILLIASAAIFLTSCLVVAVFLLRPVTNTPSASLTPHIPEKPFDEAAKNGGLEFGLGKGNPEAEKIWSYAEVLAYKDKKVLTRETVGTYILAIVYLSDVYEVEPVMIFASVASIHDFIQKKGAPLDCLEIMYEMTRGHAQSKSMGFEWREALALWSAFWVAEHGKSENELERGTRKVTVTRAEYDRIELGMSYQQVTGIIGSQGEELSSSSFDGQGIVDDIHTAFYSWENGDGSNMNAIFQNGQLISKAQYLLP